MRAVIDRFEGNIAILEVEGKRMWHVPKDFLPPKVREGDALEFSFQKTSGLENINNALVEEIFE